MGSVQVCSEYRVSGIVGIEVRYDQKESRVFVSELWKKEGWVGMRRSWIGSERVS
jgi:hypothetical protein